MFERHQVGKYVQTHGQKKRFVSDDFFKAKM